MTTHISPALDAGTLTRHIDFEREGAKSNARKRETRVLCCLCKKKCTLPFKPRNPEVYCDDCFKKRKKPF